MSHFLLSVPPHAAVPGRYDRFAQVNGEPWTDILGKNSATAKEFRIRGGETVDFFYPITSVVFAAPGLPQKCNQAAVRFQTNSWGRLERFALFDGRLVVPQCNFSNLSVSGDYRDIWQWGYNYFTFADHEISVGLMIRATFSAWATNYDATVGLGAASIVSRDGADGTEMQKLPQVRVDAELPQDQRSGDKRRRLFGRRSRRQGAPQP